MLFHRHHPKARSAEWAYLLLLLLFVCILTVRPAVGLAGIGAISVIGSLQVLANKDLIWENYKKNWKKSKNSTRNKLTKPDIRYYNINVYLIWPAVLFAGIAMIAISLVVL